MPDKPACDHDHDACPNACRSSTTDERDTNTAAGRRLEVFTLSWNVVEATVSIASGWSASSISLIGFGVDAVIESLSGAVLFWRLRSSACGESREGVALRLVGVSFLLLAASVAFGAGRSLIQREPPDASLAGIAIACLSLTIMPTLARAKRRVASKIQSRALEADSRQTNLCAVLSAILLGGLLLNQLLGWWWADPIAALAMVPIITREGVLALRGQACQDCH